MLSTVLPLVATRLAVPACRLSSMEADDLKLHLMVQDKEKGHGSDNAQLPVNIIFSSPARGLSPRRRVR